MINENDSILVFEYFTASGEKEKNIISEAEELIFALLDDLSDFNVDLVINKSYEDIVKDFSNVNPILIAEDIVDYIADIDYIEMDNFVDSYFEVVVDMGNMFDMVDIYMNFDLEYF